MKYWVLDEDTVHRVCDNKTLLSLMVRSTRTGTYSSVCGVMVLA